MLITSISGIRGTIGGKVGENLTPIDIVSFVSAYSSWILKKYEKVSVVVGRDARKSGNMIINITISTLQSFGIDVILLDLATTPTVEMEVIRHNAQGGIIITASHNPKEYNGIKMLNNNGEFLSYEEGSEILEISNKKDFDFALTDNLGVIKKSHNHLKNHIEDILDLDLVDSNIIRKKNYKIVIDTINSVGGIAVPFLLEKLGVDVVGLNINPNGEFAHKPEPLEENLSGIKKLVKQERANMGIVVDPDVDRLVFIDDRGEMFGEEYTIVSIADYVLSEKKGNTVSNLSSSRALADITKKYGGAYFSSAVGEKNVVEKMKEVNAVIGGEGSGGVIYPQLHYGRDALVGIALFLTYLAKRDISISKLRDEYPSYFMSKEKIILNENLNVNDILRYFYNKYRSENISNIDGVKIDFENSWVHLRKSNTEPIIRVYTEAKTQRDADMLVEKIILEIHNFNKNIF